MNGAAGPGSAVQARTLRAPPVMLPV